VSALAVEDLKVSYGDIHAVKGISFEVLEGEVFTLIGANGAGKTSTLRAISGLLRHGGRVRFAGRELDGIAPDRIVALGMAHVPEGRGIFGNLTVTENLRLGAWVRADRKAVADDMERVFGLLPRLRERRDQAAGTLSGGEQQMLAVARALMSRPRVLLMDEPSLGLAPLIVAEIFDIVGELNRDGTTIFLVEQNAHMALKVAHQFFLMEQGRVTFKGMPGQLAEDEVIQRAYLGTRRAG
jgi:branched-chain amino acid transport system ATP-binding protein